MLLIYRYMDHNVHSFKLLLLFCTWLKKMVHAVLKLFEKITVGDRLCCTAVRHGCLREIEVLVLRRTKRVTWTRLNACMLRASVERRAKQMDKKNTDELMQMLRSRETVENLAKTSRMRCYGHALRRDEDGALRNVQSVKVKGQKNRTTTQNMEASRK